MKYQKFITNIEKINYNKVGSENKKILDNFCDFKKIIYNIFGPMHHAIGRKTIMNTLENIISGTNSKNKEAHNHYINKHFNDFFNINVNEKYLYNITNINDLKYALIDNIRSFASGEYISPNIKTDSIYKNFIAIHNSDSDKPPSLNCIFNALEDANKKKKNKYQLTKEFISYVLNKEFVEKYSKKIFELSQNPVYCIKPGNKYII